MVDIRAIIRPKFCESNPMAKKYNIGQSVIIKPVKEQRMSPRSSDLEQYAGQTGKVTNYYWISPRNGEVFYLYTVQIDTGKKEIVLHEDEMEFAQSRKTPRR